MKIEILVLPEKNRGVSLATELPKEVWDKLRREVYRDANYTCMICYVSEVEVHCHEIWELDFKKLRQRLVGFSCLCSDCHAAIHWQGTLQDVAAGKRSRSDLKRIERHFCDLNNCTPKDMQMDLERAQLAARSIEEKAGKKGVIIDWGPFEPSKVVKAYTERR